MSNVINIDQSKNANANLTGFELTGILMAAFLVAETVTEGVRRYMKSRLLGKEVVALTKGGRAFRGTLVAHSRFMGTVTIEGEDGDKQTLRWGSLTILEDIESLRMTGAFEELEEKRIVGDVTKEEYLDLKNELKEKRKALRSGKPESADTVEEAV